MKSYFRLKLEHSRESLTRPLSEMTKNLHQTTRRFKRNVQSDPHELYLEIVNSLPRAWKRLFEGKLESKLECARGHVHQIQESFLNISLDVPSVFGRRRKPTQILLKNLVRQFTHAREKIFGFKCSGCGDVPGQVVRKYSFREMPEILVFHLKLFDSMARKKNTKVSFDDTIKMGETEYQVVSLVEHRGRGIHFGHYVSYCRRSDGIWVLLNDSRVSTVSKRELVNRVKPYMILYQKVRTHKDNTPKHSDLGAEFNPAEKVPDDTRNDSESTEKNIDDIFAQGKNNKSDHQESTSKIEIEEPEPAGDESLMQSLNKLKKTGQYQEYMGRFRELNQEVLKAKEDMRTDTFCHNGKEFRVKDLVQNEARFRIKEAAKESNFLRLNKKFGRLSRMTRALKKFKFSGRKSEIVKSGNGGSIESIQMKKYLNKVTRENSRDLLSTQARKSSYDIEYDKGKTKKIKKKLKRKKKKLNFQKEYLKRLATDSN